MSPFDLLAQIQTFLRPKVSQNRADTAGPAPDAGTGQWVSLGSGPGQAGQAGTEQAQPRFRVPCEAGGRTGKALDHFVFP